MSGRRVLLNDCHPLQSETFHHACFLYIWEEGPGRAPVRQLPLHYPTSLCNVHAALLEDGLFNTDAILVRRNQLQLLFLLRAIEIKILWSLSSALAHDEPTLDTQTCNTISRKKTRSICRRRKRATLHCFISPLSLFRWDSILGCVFREEAAGLPLPRESPS